MASLENRIDELYRIPLSGFVSARAALAKTLGGEDARRVKALKKPTAVPWAVNQLYWSARPAYDRLVKCGDALRRAQIAGLTGRTADVRAASVAHRDAVLAAVKEAKRLAAAEGIQPDAESLTRTLEAVSLTGAQLSEPAGRLTGPLKPAGFEALAGVAVKTPPRAKPMEAPAPPARTTESPQHRDAERRHVQEEARAKRQRDAAIRSAERQATKARAREAQARLTWQRAKADLETAERALTEARR